jgi:hypothetical protein
LVTFFLRLQMLISAWQIWVGFAWGILYCLIESIGPIFKDLHGFNQGQVGLAFLGIVYITFPFNATVLEANIANRIGSFLGFWTNLYQEMLYQWVLLKYHIIIFPTRLHRKHFLKRGPEARLYMPCVAGIVFPVGMFIYAWSSFTQVHWIGLMIGMVVRLFYAIDQLDKFRDCLIGLYLGIVYHISWSFHVPCRLVSVMTFFPDLLNPLKISYGPFASSASAGQSLFRKLILTDYVRSD